MDAARTRRTVVAAALLSFACRGAHQRYIVTATPLNIGVISQPLCVAIDPADAGGVWWWEPGQSGCATRSTGPDVFRAGGASVATRDGITNVSFRLGLHVADETRLPYADVTLLVDRDTIRSVTSGARVAIGHRATLQVPEELPRSR